MRKRIWVDGQCLQTASRMRGIGRYVLELLTELSSLGDTLDLHISFNAAMADEAIIARDLLAGWIPRQNIHIWHGVARGGEAVEGYDEKRRLSETALAFHAASLNPDICLSVSPFEGGHDIAVPLLPSTIVSAPVVGIFYDAIPYRFPAHYLRSSGEKAYYERRLSAYRGFDWNLCISEFAQCELKSILGVDNSTNIAAGLPRDFDDLLAVTGNPERDKMTLLYVGGFDWRKNLDRTIEAIGLLDHDLRERLTFRVAGAAPELAAENIVRRWAAAGLPQGGLQLLGHVSDPDLMRHYKTATALIQPSLMEGFGLTALEAIAAGTPVIAARAGALPEIVTDDGYLFDPEDVKDIARHITRIMAEPRSELPVAPGAAETLSRFTWQRTVAQCLKVFDRLEAPSGSAADNEYLEAVIDAVRPLALPTETVAGCLARAEPEPDVTPRLIIDATSTAITDGGSGIQRVVKKICGNMLDSQDAAVEPVIAFSDGDDGWFTIPDGKIALKPEEIKAEGQQLHFGRHDHILMLDSSWCYYGTHARSLRSARLRGAQVTTCLYDTVPLRSSGFTHIGMPGVFANWFQAALLVSTGFVCISKAVADELLAILASIDFPRRMNIAYWPLGADFVADIDPNHSSSGHEAPTFLMVGTIEPRKGHRVALDAFELLWKRGSNARLVIIGKLGWSADHLANRMKSHPEWGKRLFWHSKVSDEELQTHFAEADCLVASSFAEGFGLPIVEAGHFGKPVIASDIPVFREVSSKSVDSRFFPIGDAAALADTVAEFIADGPRQHDPASVNGGWENWSQSTAALKDTLLNGRWYRTYEPAGDLRFPSLLDFGDVKMRSALADEQRRHRMELVEAPLSGDTYGTCKIIFAVENLSDVIWSSAEAEEGRFGVVVRARLVPPGSGYDESERPVSRIPFVIAPSDRVYMSIEVPSTWAGKDDAHVEIELVQEGAQAFGEPLIVPTSLLRQYGRICAE